VRPTPPNRASHTIIPPIQNLCNSVQPGEAVFDHYRDCGEFEQSLPKKMTRPKSWSTNSGPGFRKASLVVQVSGGALTRKSSVARQPTSNQIGKTGSTQFLEQGTIPCSSFLAKPHHDISLFRRVCEPRGALTRTIPFSAASNWPPDDATMRRLFRDRPETEPLRQRDHPRDPMRGAVPWHPRHPARPDPCILRRHRCDVARASRGGLVGADRRCLTATGRGTFVTPEAASSRHDPRSSLAPATRAFRSANGPSDSIKV
jgi:hypothetical protein